MIEMLNTGKEQLIENIKILLYKEKEDVFEFLDFENDSIYQEPLFFAYFKEKRKKQLDPIIFGFINSEICKKDICTLSDENGRIYIPNIGWLICKQKNTKFNLSELIKEAHIKESSFALEPLLFIEGTNIEILKYPVELLKQFYYDEHLNSIEVEIEKITKRHIKNVTTAFNLIKKYAPEHFDLIESVTKKIVIFNVDTNLRNSFATLSAHGIAFFNAYQEDYNEIFFVDDIAHQTGHIIFNALIYDIDKFLKVKPSTVVQEIKNDFGIVIETRDIHVLFHALYTYYTTFICLDVMLDSREFTNEKLHELHGRMKFYLGKCLLDFIVIDNPINNYSGAEKLFTDEGLEIYSLIKNKYFEMSNKWFPVVEKYKLNNQLYNFSYSLFKDLNPL